MKKIILAPAVALAFTGLVASPVAAAESPSTQSASEQKAEQQKLEKEKAEKAKAEKEAAEKKAEEKAEAEKKAKEKEAADKKAEEEAEAKKKADAKKAAEDKADEKKDEDKPKAPKKVDPKPAPSPKDDGKDDSDKDDESEDKVNPITASVQVTSGDVTAEELADEGVTVKVTGLEEGDKVSAESGLTGSSTTAQGSTATLKLHSAKKVTQESVAFAVQVQREGTQTQTLTDSVAVTSDQDQTAATVKPTVDKMTTTELGENGIEVSGEGFTPGKKIEVWGGNQYQMYDSTTVTADEGGAISATVPPPSEGDIIPGQWYVTAHEVGSDDYTDDAYFTVVDDTAGPEVKLDQKEISLDDFKKNGLEFTGEGFTPNGGVSVEGKPVSTQRAAQADEIRADEHGNVSGVVTAPESLEAGTYSLTFTDDETGETTDPVEITVTEEDAVDPIESSLKIDPTKSTPEDLSDKSKGITVTLTNLQAGDIVVDSLTEDPREVKEDGDYSFIVYYKGDPDDLKAGEQTITVTVDRAETESAEFTDSFEIVTENGDTPEAPAEATLKVSPKTIEAADFANEKKGVTLAVENCEPGQDVHFEVNPKGINVTAYENTVKADDEGNASVNVFGTSSDASAYVGSYTATATCGDDTMKDSFTVTEGANGGGDNGGGDNGNAGSGDGSQLPRTGADLGGLTTGALLLLVGGAAIAVTGRKNKFGQNPMSF